MSRARKNFKIDLEKAFLYLFTMPFIKPLRLFNREMYLDFENQNSFLSSIMHWGLIIGPWPWLDNEYGVSLSGRTRFWAKHLPSIEFVIRLVLAFISRVRPDNENISIMDTDR